MCVWPAADTSCLCRGAFDDANRMFFGISIAGGILLLVVVAGTNQSDLSSAESQTDHAVPRNIRLQEVTGGHAHTVTWVQRTLPARAGHPRTRRRQGSGPCLDRPQKL